MLIKQNQLVINGTTLEQSDLQAIANVASDVQAQIDTKAPINNAQFTGNVGIGTNSPASTLDTGYTRIYNSGAASSPSSGKGLEVHYVTSGRTQGEGAYLIPYDRDNGQYKPLTIDAITTRVLGGNTLIGPNSLTDSFTASQRLHVYDPSTAYILAETGGTGTSAGHRSTAGSNDWVWFATEGQPNYRLYDYSSSAVRLTVKNDGNVGIGTTDPSGLLTINQGGVTGYIRMEGPSSGDYAGGLLMYRGSTLRGSIYTNPTHNMTILSETGINFRSYGAERFRIDYAQANMVHVQGDTADHSGTGGGSKGLSIATAGGTSCPIYFGSETNSAQKSMYMNGYWIYLRGHQNEGIRFVFSQGGGTAIRSDQYQFKYNSAYRPTGNTTWDGFSDSRAKENVTNLTGALDTISQLRPVTFDWTDDYADTMNMFEMDTTDEKSYNHFSVKENGYDLDRKTSQIGFIAQEFEEVFPKSITETEMQLGDTKVEDFKTVNYDHLIPVLTKSIQELKAENDALKARIEALETRLDNAE